MTAVKGLMDRRANDAAVVLFPVMAGLLVFAGALVRSVGLGTALLLALTAEGVRSNRKVLEDSRFLALHGVLPAAKLMILVHQVMYRNLPLGGVDWPSYHRFGSQIVLDAGGSLGNYGGQ